MDVASAGNASRRRFFAGVHHDLLATGRFECSVRCAGVGSAFFHHDMAGVGVLEVLQVCRAWQHEHTTIAAAGVAVGKRQERFTSSTLQGSTSAAVVELEMEACSWDQ
eukprot:1924841-Amphidinium_carterae.1